MIGVIDLLDGQAVHARGGRRDEYQPIGDAVELARTYVDRHGVKELYVADLNSIGGPERPAPQELFGIAPVWFDAGISTVGRACEAIDLGAARVIVGLETLPSFTALQQICEAIGGPRVALSLDLRDGVPLGIGHGEDAAALAAQAARAGAGAIVVLDLARASRSRSSPVRIPTRARSRTIIAPAPARAARAASATASSACPMPSGTASRRSRLKATRGPPIASQIC